MGSAPQGPTPGAVKVVCTYCSATKRRDTGDLPAVQRYVSTRITGLQREAEDEGALFRILSGRHGLLAPNQPLGYYDHLLQPTEVAVLVPGVVAALGTAHAETLVYHTADPECFPAVRPYLEVMDQACGQAGVPMEVVILAGNPA